MSDYDNRLSGWLGACSGKGAIKAEGSLRDSADNIYDAKAIAKGDGDKQRMEIMVCTGTPLDGQGNPVDAGKVYNRVGILFNNSRKEKDNQPDYTGTISIDGVRWLSAWKGTKDGQHYLSLKFDRLKEERAASEASGPAAGAGGGYGGGGFDDDIPF